MYYKDVDQRKAGNEGILLWVIIGLLFVMFIAFPVLKSFSSEVSTIEVHNTPDIEDSRRFTVYAETTEEDGGNSLFEELDVTPGFQNRLDEDHCYQVILEGWRIPRLGWSRSIVDIHQELDCDLL